MLWEPVLRWSLGSSAHSPVRYQPSERQQARSGTGPSVPPGQLGHSVAVSMVKLLPWRRINVISRALAACETAVIA